MNLYVTVFEVAPVPMTLQGGGHFHLKVGGAKSRGNAGDPMLGVAVIP